MVCDYDGYMQHYIKDAPFNHSIECITPTEHGLVVALREIQGKDGHLWSYECQNETPYALLQKNIGHTENAERLSSEVISSFCITEKES